MNFFAVLYLPAIMALLALTHGLCRAQGTAGTNTPATDTIRVYQVPEVVVRASASPTLQALESIQPTTVITRQNILALNASDAADAIAFAPGVFVRQYGGLGGLRTVSLRGASAQQSVVLIDGVRYQSSAEGAVDFSNIPATLIERIEVLRGGNSAAYGANALGGVINIVTRGAMPAGLVRISAQGTAGSFRTGELAGSAAYSAGAHNFDLSARSVHTAGDYPFQYNEFGQTSQLLRANADFSNLFARAAWWFHPTSGLNTGASFQGFHSTHGAPGPVLQGSHADVNARLDELDLFATGSASLRADDWQGGGSASVRRNTTRYTNPDLRLGNGQSVDNNYDRREAALNLRLQKILGQTGALEITADAGYTVLHGDNLDPSAPLRPERLQAGLALHSQWIFNQVLPGCQATLTAGLRADYFSDISALPLSPALGLGLLLPPGNLRLRARLASSFRTPSFVEKYYFNYGNAALRPERSWSADAGATWQADSALGLECSVFLTDTRDHILAVPRNTVSWSARNLGRTISQGFELSMFGTAFAGMLDVMGSYTYTNASDRSDPAVAWYNTPLPYTPEHLLNAAAGLHVLNGRAGITFSYAGLRYTLPGAQASGLLPAYLLAGANIACSLRLPDLELHLRAEAENLFGTDYQVIRNYPMPGRSFRVTISTTYTRSN